MRKNDLLQTAFKGLMPQFEAINLFLGIIFIPLAISFLFRDGFMIMAGLDFTISITCLLMHFFRKKLSFHIRIGISLLMGMFFAVISLYRGGFMGNGLISLIFVIIVAEIFLGKRSAIIIASMACSVLIFMTAAIYSGFIDLHRLNPNRIYEKIDWIYQSICLIMLSVVCFYMFYKVKGILFNNIDKLIESEEKLKMIAYKDYVTGLPNRAFFYNEMFKKAQNNIGQPFIMAIFDVINFRLINTLFGMEQGDRVLKDIGETFERNKSNDIHIARIGGNEFIFLAFKWDESRFRKFVDEFMNQLFSGNETLRGVHKIRFIITFIKGNFGKEEFYSAYRDLSISLKYAREKGLSGIIAYESFMREKYEHENLLLSKIEAALRDDKFEVYFQGKWDVSKEAFVSFEALSRWYDEGKFVSPEIFISLIYRSQYFIPFSQYIFCKSLERFVALAEELELKAPGHVKSDASLAINISPAFFCSENFTEFVLENVEKSGIDTSRIILEITEDIFISDIEKTNEIILYLQKKGIRISLDDFGTGYSSLSHLNQIQIDELKIDKSFIRNIQYNDKSRVLLSGIMAIAEKMGCPVVVEGVETEAELGVVKELGCQVIQGYYYSKPQAVEDWIRKIKD